MTLVLSLPWPDRRLHPNARPHRMEKAKVTKKARLDAAWAARAALAAPIVGESLAITAVFFPPNGRARDLDGLLSSLKPALDGISDVIGIDDSKWTIALRREAPRPPHGAVEIHIEVAA